MAGMDEMYCPSYKLVFPRLETVTIHMCPSRGGILQFSEFPSQGLKRLELGNAICSDISLDGIKRPIVVEHLVICATITQTANRQDPVYVYNSIVDKVKSGVHGTTIIMPFGTALTKPLQARWQSLSKLELYEPTPISMLLELVPRLPSLKRLTAHYLIIDADCKVSSIAKDYSCSILSYSLNELILDTYDTGHDEKFQKAVCYIMALAPQLNVVVVPETSATSLRTDGVVVASIPPNTEVRHIYNGTIVDVSDINDPNCRHIDGCNWNPFKALETDSLFYTYIDSTPDKYTITIHMPAYISRYIRVQKNSRVLAIIGKAMAQRKWKDKEHTNVHEQWKVYWRLFRIPLQCNIVAITARYEADRIIVSVPRRTAWPYKLAAWAEKHVPLSSALQAAA
ncbi:hypothetical protein LPJ81_003702, partial [Coemansia sp. IMI 209127]